MLVILWPGASTRAVGLRSYSPSMLFMWMPVPGTITPEPEPVDALTVCDELLDAGNQIRSLERELESLRDVRSAASERARATQLAVANALSAAAERIERTTQVLNRTVGGGVAIG